MAAIVSLRQSKSQSRSIIASSNAKKPHDDDASGEPLSFHLAFVLGNDYVLSNGNDSVDVLRLPFISNEGKPSRENLTGTIMEFRAKKFNSTSLPFYNKHGHDKAWQDRLLVITEKRIFIITEKAKKSGDKKQTCCPTTLHFNDLGAKGFGSAGLEIVDSIPMEEILSVSMDMDSDPGVWRYEKVDKFRQSTTNLQELERNLQEIEVNLRQSRPRPTEHPEFCEPILRILTKPSKFNRGEPFYFLLGKQDFNSVEADGNVAHLHSRADAAAMTSRIASLAARRRTEHARENRFLRLQKILRHVWSSVPFNVAVLALIASNFAFTVLQLENRDPAMQPFYEDVDLAYTIIFAVGTSEPLSTRHTNARTAELISQGACGGCGPPREEAHSGWHRNRAREDGLSLAEAARMGNGRSRARVTGRLCLVETAPGGWREWGSSCASACCLGAMLPLYRLYYYFVLLRAGRAVLQLPRARLLALHARLTPRPAPWPPSRKACRAPHLKNPARHLPPPPSSTVPPAILATPPRFLPPLAPSGHPMILCTCAESIRTRLW
jgi:hypothetical protein